MRTKATSSVRKLTDSEVASIRTLAKTVIGWTRVKRLLDEMEAQGRALDNDVKWRADFDKILRLTESGRVPIQDHHRVILRRTLRKGLCDKFRKTDDELDGYTGSLAGADLAPALGLLRAPQHVVAPGPSQAPAAQPGANALPPPPDRAFAMMFDENLLSDYLTGVGFAEWMGTEAEWEKLVRRGKEWLKTHPEDLYHRGMFFWSVLRRGNPSEMVEALSQTAQWLAPASPVAPGPDASRDSGAYSQKIAEKIDQFNRGAVEYPDFVRWHLEDNLVRATLLRYLRLQGRGSRLEKEFAQLSHDLENHPALRALIATTRTQQGDSWVATAVAQVGRWAGGDHESALARLCLLWFTGRQGRPDQMQVAIDESCHWLARNRNQSLVRWAATWLAGLAPEGEPISRVIGDTADWLKTEAPDDDRLVQMGFLWLVGARGSPAQVRGAIVQTAEWLKAHPEDDFIRVAYLLFLMRRRGTPEERRRFLVKTREWLRRHPDVYGLTDLSLRLFESAPA